MRRTRFISLAIAVAFVACGPTTYTDNRDVFRDNIEERLDRLEERVSDLWRVMDERLHVEPEFSIFVSDADADIRALRSRLAGIDSIAAADWPEARSQILRETRDLERRLSRVRISDYP
jgi:hypothetical protein